MPGFDIDGARKEGYSDSDILGHLTQTRNFDVEGARKEGYSDADIIEHLRTTAPKQPSSAPKDTRLPFGVPGGREHKSFAETVGTQTPLGKAATFLGGVSKYVPSAETVMGMGVPVAEGTQVVSGIATAGKRALGVGAALGTGLATDKALQALGMPPWLSETVGSVAGIAVGGKVGLSPETLETLKGSGVRRLLTRWLKGTNENEAIQFYRERHPEIKAGQALTGEQKLTAKAEASQFKKQMADALKKAGADPFEETRGKVGKELSKYTPSRAPSSPSYGTAKVKPSERGGSIRDEPVPAPAESFEAPGGGIKKQALKFTPGKEPSGGGPARAPIKVKPSEAGGTPPESDMPSGDFPNRGKLKGQLLKKTASGQGSSSGSGPTRAPKYGRFTKDKPESAATEDIMQEDGKPLMKGGTEDPADLPNSGKPKRAPRSDPEAQKRSDEIASLNRHADAYPLAQKAVQDGVTSKDLLSMPESAKQDFMKRIGLGGRSDATWRTFVGHVLRLEKLKK